MLNDLTRTRLVGYWFFAVAFILASVTAMGVSVNVRTAALLLTLSLVPPGVLLALWHGSPPPKVGDILYATNPRTERRS